MILCFYACFKFFLKKLFLTFPLCVSKANYSAVTTDGRVVPSAWEDSPSYNVMYINHYCTKSKEDFQKKKKRGGGAGRVATDAWFDRINRDAVHNCSVLAMPPPRLRP